MVICCVCYYSEHITKKCKGCVETYICDNCIGSMMEKGLLGKCPICRKSDKWLVSLSNKDIVINDDRHIYRDGSVYRGETIDDIQIEHQEDDLYSKCLDDIYKLSIFSIFLLICLCIGLLTKLINNMCIICDNIWLDIMITIFIGLMVMTVIIWIFIIIIGCILACLGNRRRYR